MFADGWMYQSCLCNFVLTLSVSMCVSLHVSTWWYADVWMSIHVYMCVHTCIYVCPYMCICVSIHEYMCVHTCVYVCPYMCLYSFICSRVVASQSIRLMAYLSRLFKHAVHSVMLSNQIFLCSFLSLLTCSLSREAYLCLSAACVQCCKAGVEIHTKLRNWKSLFVLLAESALKVRTMLFYSRAFS